MAVSYAGLPFDLVRSSLRLIGEKVVPALQRLGTAGAYSNRAA
jgi:hypothetical protein